MGLQFNGSPDRLEFGTSSLFNAGSGSFTMMGWGMIASGMTTAGVMFGKGANGGGQMRYKLEYDGGASNFLKFEIDDNGAGGKLDVFTTTALNDGLMHHIAGVRDNANNVIRVYVDGIQEATLAGAATYGNIDDTEPQIMGAFRNAGGGLEEFLDGQLEDCRIYIGRALPASEIMTICAARGHDDIVQNLTARWPLNEQSAGTPVTVASEIKDVSPNGLNGTVVNSSPTWEPSELSFRKLVH